MIKNSLFFKFLASINDLIPIVEIHNNLLKQNIFMNLKKSNTMVINV